MPNRKSLALVGVIALLGAGFVGLLYYNRNIPRPAPAAAKWAGPAKGVRVVSCDVSRAGKPVDQVLRDLLDAKADFVLLQGVSKRDLTTFSEALGTLPAIYHASGNLESGAKFGNAILTRYPLYEAGEIPGGMGVWATASIEDHKFVLASVNLAAGGRDEEALMAAWRGRGSPPLVVAGNIKGVGLAGVIAGRGAGEAIGFAGVKGDALEAAGGAVFGILVGEK